VFAQAVQVGVVLEAVFHDVAHIHGGLEGHQAQGLEDQLFVVAERHGARGLAFVEVGQELFENGDELLGILVAGAALLAFAVDGLLDGGHVGQGQFGDDGFDVGERVDLAIHVDDVLVFKAAHHVDDGVGFADVGQELVAQAFALGGAGHQAGDVHEFDDGRLDLLRLDDLDKASSRGSGTSTMPTLGSMVQKG
jgi:hypothetical protein